VTLSQRTCTASMPPPRSSETPITATKPSPAGETPASRHDVTAPDTRGRVHRGPPRRRAMKCSGPRPVRPALPSRRASHAVATRAARAVDSAAAAQAVATHAASCMDRAALSHAEMGRREFAAHRRRPQRAERGAVDERTGSGRPGREERRGGGTR
jgi:hypothetical protein